MSAKGKLAFRTILDVLSCVEDRYLNSSAQPSVKKGKVKIRTVHSAKGLQWDTVFFIDGDTIGRGPYDMDAVEREGSGNEEVRINYVGVTRARNRLIV